MAEKFVEIFKDRGRYFVELRERASYHKDEDKTVAGVFFVTIEELLDSHVTKDLLKEVSP